MLGFPLFAATSDRTATPTPAADSTPAAGSTATPELPTPTATPQRSFTEAPAISLAENGQYSTIIRTSKGVIRAELLPKDAPGAVNNFHFLAGKGYFTDLPINAVIPGVRVEVGAPNFDGSGGPGYVIPATENSRQPQVGDLMMATGPEGTFGSKFFIALGPQPDASQNQTIFGRVIDGLDIARELSQDDRLISIRSSESVR